MDDRPSRKGGTLIYRCRRCGRQVESYHVPDLIIALVCLIQGRPAPAEWGLRAALIGLHACPDGWEGVTDLIAGRPDGAPDDLGTNPGATPARRAPADLMGGDDG